MSNLLLWLSGLRLQVRFKFRLALKSFLLLQQPRNFFNIILLLSSMFPNLIPLRIALNFMQAGSTMIARIEAGGRVSL